MKVKSNNQTNQTGNATDQMNSSIDKSKMVNKESSKNVTVELKEPVVIPVPIQPVKCTRKFQSG